MLDDDAANTPGSAVVELARAGDREAFRQLFEYHNLMVHRYLAGLVGDREYARDLVQDTFTRVWLNLSDLQDPSRFKPWLFSIARNRAIDYWRSRKREVDSCEGQDGDISDPDPGETVVERNLVLETLLKLPRNYRECLLLQYAGFSHQEIARLTGLTRKSVSTYICTARKEFIRVYTQLNLLSERR